MRAARSNDTPVMRTRSLLVVVAASSIAVFAAACGKKQSAGFSEPVVITIGVKSSDVNGVDLTEIKNINTGGANPFSKFVNDATAKLGHAPSSIALKHLTMTTGTGGTLTNLDQVWGGRVDVSYQLNGSATYAAGYFPPTPSGASYNGVSTFDSTTMPQADYALFVGGQFKIAVQGSAAASFAGAGITNGSLDVVFQFEAFK